MPPLVFCVFFNFEDLPQIGELVVVTLIPFKKAPQYFVIKGPEELHVEVEPRIKLNLQINIVK